MDANSEVNERNECHMIRSAKEHRLTHVELKSGFTTVEEIYGSSGFDVWVDKCKQCGQLFIYCFKEKCRPCGDDDYWSFWVPVEESEIETVRNASPLLRFMGGSSEGAATSAGAQQRRSTGSKASTSPVSSSCRSRREE